MIYIFSTFESDMFHYIFDSLDEPVKVITYPNSINGGSLKRKIAHALWKVGVFIKWNFFGKEFNDFVENIKEDDKVIFYASFPEHILNVVPYLKHREKARIWIWDILDTKPFLLEKLDVLRKLNVPISTFDPLEAKKYNLIYLPQVYNFRHPHVLKKEKAIMSSCDCYYLGYVNTDYRKKIINEVESLFSQYGLTFYKHSVNKGGCSFISYQQNLDNIAQCKALLELNNEGQSGPTLRAMEVISFRKKLITNNSYIKNYDFYNKSNIFILGEDDPSTLKEFINTPYQDVPSNVIERYDVNTWIKNIFK